MTAAEHAHAMQEFLNAQQQQAFGQDYSMLGRYDILGFLRRQK
jgi:hypothetical protein